ncbi:Phosphoribosyltransferase [Vibrio chagasii]|nr:Phosphoribosyltransferase [Vibrio chagasii]CAH7024133.1 Phosphoribosyltransferase [Vibrio chagasii]CAH7030147.1 Phosphoribosyltransferase [Vibrio chagasii]CAH7088916.1 Phosphoribosyltransferase [Vibrio chagasii]CAH7274136.1 Phosphoribosyltransferase [Vibrio chagasii]
MYQPKAGNADDFYSIPQYKEKIEWLQDECYDAGLMTLLSEFPNDPERALIFTLLSRVQHFQISDRVKDIALLVKKLEELKLDPKETLIVATAEEAESDGSKAWQYFFKFFLAQHRAWTEDSLVSSIEASFKVLKKRSYKNVVIFDDFIGSGKTMVDKVNGFSKALKERMDKEPKVYIFALAGMQFGVDCVQRKLDNVVFCPVLVKKGISDQEISDEKKAEEIALMKKMEKKLRKKYRCEKFFKMSLGYKESQALYQVQFTNCSNNVFPIFWVSPRGKGNFRQTLFYRL